MLYQKMLYIVKEQKYFLVYTNRSSLPWQIGIASSTDLMNWCDVGRINRAGCEKIFPRCSSFNSGRQFLLSFSLAKLILGGH